MLHHCGAPTYTVPPGKIPAPQRIALGESPAVGRSLISWRRSKPPDRKRLLWKNDCVRRGVHIAIDDGSRTALVNPRFGNHV